MEFFQKSYNMYKSIHELEGWYKQQQDVLASAWTSIGQSWSLFLESLDISWDVFAGFAQQLSAMFQVAKEYFTEKNEGKSLIQTISDFFKDFVQKVFYRDMSQEPAPAAGNAGAAAQAAGANEGAAAEEARGNQEPAQQNANVEPDMNPADFLARLLFANRQQPNTQPSSYRNPRRRG